MEKLRKMRGGGEGRRRGKERVIKVECKRGEGGKRRRERKLREIWKKRRDTKGEEDRGEVERKEGNGRKKEIQN